MIKLKTQIPGPKSSKILNSLKNRNGGWGVPHPIVHSSKGKGPYTQDLDGNVFLDFACQIASNPMGYNHPEMLKVLKKSIKRFPVKYAGQDFTVKEHLDFIETVTDIAPKGMNTMFVVNSGAEAVENAIKICMRNRKNKKFSISVDGSFHGRTLGALSLHHSKPVHRKGYMLEPNKELLFSDNAGDKLKSIIDRYGASSIAFVILEHLQGEGGYRVPSKKMVNDLRRITSRYKIPYIADEVQAGMGRTGKWWAFEHYGIRPEAFSTAKALQLGAVVANKKQFPNEPGSISSTWGGGHIIDMMLGMKTIEIIKRDKLLDRNRKNGNYILKRIKEIEGTYEHRGRGMMVAFDLDNSKDRDNFVIECARNGLLILGCAQKGVRIIPPYIIERDEIDEGLNTVEKAVKKVTRKGFKHKGNICKFMGCAEGSS